ncbi:MAG TPA: DUF1127 domain-containing protein [Geminicoccaceae bacterium]
MTSEANARTFGATAGAGWHRADDLIMAARRERALWLRSLLRGGLDRVASTRVGAALGDWRQRRNRRAEVEELLLLDDRALADIGLRREDLWSVRHGRTTLQQLVARQDGGMAELLAFRRPTAAPIERPASLDRAA